MIKRIFVFGDSIAFGSNDWVCGGWVNRLKGYFAKTGQFHHVYNLGVSGENSSDVLKRIKREIKPRGGSSRANNLLIVQVPVNDTRYKKNAIAKPEISSIKFKRNLKEFKKIGNSIADATVFIGMTKVVDKKTIPWVEVVDRRIVCWKNEIVKRYNKEIKNFCEKEKVYYVDIFDLLNNSDISDGLHPNEVGHEKMYKKIKNFLISKKLIKNI